MPLKPTHLHPHNTAKQFVFLIIAALFFANPAQAQMDTIRDLYGRALSAYDNKDFDQAFDLYQQITKIAPGFAPAYNGMALANEAALGDEDKTIAYLKTAISYDPRLIQAYDNLGRIYYGREDMDQAEEYFEKELKIDPNLSNAQLSLAWINLLVKSRPEKAIKYFKMVLKVSQDPKIYYGLGQAYFASNQRNDALDMITKLHELGQEDLASRLEQSMRENAEVNAQTQNPDGNPSKPAGLGPVSPTTDKPTGMTVRLRGKLSDY